MDSQDPGETAGVKLEGAETKHAVLCALDFEPEDRPKGLIEGTFLFDASARFAAGLYELRYVRPLTRKEWAARAYREIIAKAGASQ